MSSPRYENFAVALNTFNVESRGKNYDCKGQRIHEPLQWYVCLGAVRLDNDPPPMPVVQCSTPSTHCNFKQSGVLSLTNPPPYSSSSSSLSSSFFLQLNNRYAHVQTDRARATKQLGNPFDPRALFLPPIAEHQSASIAVAAPAHMAHGTPAALPIPVPQFPSQDLASSGSSQHPTLPLARRTVSFSPKERSTSSTPVPCTLPPPQPPSNFLASFESFPIPGRIKLLSIIQPRSAATLATALPRSA
jgi:hypothetical protein